MLGIDPNIAYQELAIGQERLVTIKVKIDKLLKVGFIKEALHITWLANVVMI